jgi:hypothetical protein
MHETVDTKRARLAKRRLVDGRLFAADAPSHGSANTYQYWGCRCRPCTAANASATAGVRARRRERLAMYG